MKHPLCTLVAIALLMATPATAGQQAQKPEPLPTPSTQKPEGVPLRVQLVLAKYKGDKKTTSLPYAMSATTGQVARLRVGADVPYTSTTFTPVKPTADKPAEPIQSHQYRTVGVNITCLPTVTIDGRYKLDLSLSDDSIAYDDDSAARPRGVPVFRTFSTTNTLVLKDGETGQITTAADPITGEVLRVDVTLTVMK